MKTKRLVALFLVLLLALSAASFAAAEEKAKGIEFNQNNLVIENGETVKLNVFYSPYSIYTEDGTYYNNIEFDCDSVVKGKVLSGGSWVTVTNSSKKDCAIKIDRNETSKARTAKIKLTGTGYSATIVLTQFGMARVISAKRSGKSVTLKLQKTTGAKVHYLGISSYSLNSDGVMDYNEYSYKRIFDGKYTKKSYKFSVKAGYQYEFDYGVAIKNKWGGYTWTSRYYSIDVTSVSGSQVYKFDE